MELEKFAPDVLQVVKSETSLDLVEICRRHTDEMHPLPVAEPFSYVLNFMYAREVLRRGVRISAAVGYSLGEFAALAVTGAIDFATGLKLVRARAEAISEVIRERPLRMVRVEGADPEVIAEICATQGDVWTATFDSPSQLLVGGEPEALDRAAPHLKEAGAERIVLVLNNGGLHTPPMRKAHEAMVALLADVEISKPKVPVWSTISARVEHDPERWRDLLAEQVHAPVRWQETYLSLPRDVPLLECGGGRLTALAQEIEPGREAIVVDSAEAVELAAQRLAGAVAA
jgi:[acyl-carrier-protein] S-malonyltransferase